MKNNNLDKIFMSEKEQESLSPPTFVWDNLERDLKLKNRRRPVFLYWLGGLSLFLGIAGLMYFLTIENIQSVPMTTNFQTQNKNTKVEETPSTARKTQASNPSSSSHPITNKDMLSITLESKNENGSLENEYQTRTAVNNQLKCTSIPQSNVRVEAKESSGPPQNSNQRSTPVIDSNNNNNSIQIQNEQEDYLLPNPIVAIAELETQRSIKNPSILVLDLRRELMSNTFSHYTASLSTPNLTFNLDHSPIKIPKIRNSLTAYFHIGKPIFSKTTLSGDNVNNAEADWYSLGGGLRYERNLTPKLTAGIGINYTLSKRKFNYSSDELYLLSTASSLFEYGRLLSQGEQNFTFIDLPLSIRYQFSIKRLRVSAGLSALLNLQLSTSGKTLELDGSITKYRTEDNRYQSSIGLGYSPFLSIDYPIQKHLYISISPRYTGYFIDLEDKFNERFLGYSSFGLDIGLSRRF